MTTDLAVRQIDPADLAPRFVQSLDDMKSQVQQLEQFKREIMVEGQDYGTIPGTPKPTLLKPGAEKLALVFGLAPTFVSSTKIEDWDNGFFFYDEECRLTSKRTGDVVASANGSANSREPRYRWRKAERVCPDCSQATIIKGKADWGGGWLCWKKNGGCGTKFSDGDHAIEGQVVGNVANPEPFELVNTIKKMAQKRALVAATLIATGGSGVWTQDVEDMPSMGGDGEVIEGNGRVIVQEQPAQRGELATEITSADNNIWQGWLKLLAEAQGLGLKDLPTPRLPIMQARLVKLGKDVRDAVNARKAELAAKQVAIYGTEEQSFADLPAAPPKPQDARPLGETGVSPEPAGKPKGKAKAAEVPMIEHPEDARYQRYMELMEEARSLDVAVDGYALNPPVEASKVEATIVALEQDILNVEQAETEAAAAQPAAAF